MYENFYGFTENPFSMTPDTKYLFYSSHHREAFAALKYGIEQKKGFIVITGEVGTGKTTICRAILNQLDPTINVALIFNPMMSEIELLKAILDDLEIEKKGETVKDIVDSLNEYLLKEATGGKTTVLIIDEAQDLSSKLLEQIRLLSNLETEKEKLLQIVLVGQPELMYNLQKEELRQLRQRITVSYHLKPLNKDEVKRYIQHRLSVAGDTGSITFADKSVGMIYRYSRGIPRLINSLCDKCLLVAYVKEVHEIDTVIVKLGIKELEGYRFPVLQKKIIPEIIRIIKYITVGTGLGLGISIVLFLFSNTELIMYKFRVNFQPQYKLNQQLLESGLKRIEKNEFILPADINEIAAFEKFLIENGAKEVLLPRESFRGMSDLLFTALEKNGYKAYFYVGNLGTIKNIGLPAFIRISIHKTDEMVFLPILKFSKDRYTVVFSAENVIDVFSADIDRIFNGRAIIVYKEDDKYLKPILRAGMKNYRVTELKKRLEKLGYKVADYSDTFDSNFEIVVKNFQADYGLISDGIYGNQTAMLLYRVFSEKVKL
ncbi:MAG: AAA family ATPase [Candidatus Hydrogenedentota bacterium]